MSKLETLIENLNSSTDIDKALEMFKENFIEDKENYKKEFEGVRNLRQGQIERRTQKGEAEDAMIPLDFQGQIVSAAMAFLVGEAPVIEVSDPKTSENLNKVWKKVRLNNLIKKFVTALKSETEAVIIFSVKPKILDKEASIKAKLYTHEHGEYAPLYDDYGDLVAFDWRFKQKDDEGNERQHHWIFTDDFTYRFIEEGGSGWKAYDENGKEPNILGKIPVVFMRQKFPEWWKVRRLIDRYELSFSKFCDTNDYFGSPMVVIHGEIKELPDKDKAGKVLQLEAGTDGHGKDVGAKVEYLTWPHGAESTKLEWEHAKELIHSMTNTPDISFSALKGVTPPSGYAMKLQFLGAILKSKENGGDLIIAMERMCNVLIGIMGKFFSSTLPVSDDYEIDITLADPLPEAVEAMVETLTLATGGKIMSTATAVKLNPLVSNNEEEIAQVEKESREIAGSYEIE